jgi:hypothetical protein
MKIRPMEAEYHADRRTDMTKLIVAFRKFANVPKKTEFYSCNYCIFEVRSQSCYINWYLVQAVINDFHNYIWLTA